VLNSNTLGIAMSRRLALHLLVSTLLVIGGNSVHSAPQQTPRGVQPSYVTNNSIVLCKSASSIANTYEIRLTIFFAVKDKKAFELRVPAGAAVDPDLVSLIKQQGGRISEQSCPEFTVSFTHFAQDGTEKDSWVLGDRAAWDTFRSSLKSAWLREELKPGASVSGQALRRLKQELSGEAIRQRNIDDENIQQALQRLVQECESQGGNIRVQ
jgi:hypothetical protein